MVKGTGMGKRKVIRLKGRGRKKPRGRGWDEKRKEE